MTACGAAAGALLASGLVGVVAASLYLRIHNEASLRLAQAPAESFARALAAKAEHAGAGALVGAAAERGLAELQRYLVTLQKGQPTIKLATVVSEPRSAKYRFLRKRRFLAHAEAARAGQALDAQSASDKNIYDLANTVHQAGAQLRTVAKPEQPTRIEAAAPVVVGGKHVAMALVVTEPPATPAPIPAWPIGAGVLLCTLLGAVAGAVLRQRPRYALVIAATLGFAVACRLLLGRLLEGYGGELRGSLDSLASALGLGSAGGAALPSCGSWVLAIAATLGLGVGVLGFTGVGARISGALRQHRFAYAYIAPAAIGMLLLVFVPFAYGLGLGFFDHQHGTYTFVGLKNFVEILSGGGRPITHPLNFYFTLGVTVLWTAVNVFLHVSLGLVLALLLKDPLLRFKGVYRVLLILPWAVPNYITALIWKGMFHYEYGAVNHVLATLGIEKVSWFSSFSTAFTANVVTNTWLGFPFMMVVCLGALQSIPKDVYEAAAVDGASPWQTFRRITLPLLRPALFPAVVLGSIWTFNMFNIIYLVSNGEPGGATDILITEAYRWAFERADRYGLAAAYALIIFVILLGYTLITNRMAKATEDVLE